MTLNSPSFLFLVVFLLGFALPGCQRHHAEHEAEKPKLEATTPFREDAVLTKEYVCQIRGVRHIEVRALERGYLQSIFVDEGQFVHQGQPMFKIMPNIYQAELLKAKAEANNMNIEYMNTKGLSDKKIVSENELALAKAKLDKALAEVKLAETHLSFTDINAPFDGIVDHLIARNGSLLDEGDLLTTLSDISKLWVYFNVPEAEYLDYQRSKRAAEKTKVQLRMANHEVFDQVGVIETIEADFDNTVGNIEFRATFPNPDKLLRHGETGTILMDKPYKNALMIPQKAVFDIMDKSYVYVVTPESKLEQRLIKIDAALPHLFIVKEGLTESDKILLEGLRKVHSGEEVEINQKSPQEVRANLELYTE
ncbi:MAG: efflux RND transporter periplasmic adaptor subunit [Methylotetracoccus sp.]